MNKTVKYDDFDAISVPLQGSNLIEASAGTGKTYSIAILVLRLVLEKGVSIKEILMVTFTKAAVAELEERIRLFIRNAYKVSKGANIKDQNIVQLVQQAIASSSEVAVQQTLRDAVLFLDETSILTIHGFCQNTLTEFAFETGQLFGTEMLPDIKPVIESELNKFWRRHITTIPVDLLSRIWDESMKAGIQKAIEEHLGGKKYSDYDPTGVYVKTAEEWSTDSEKMEVLGHQSDQLTQKVHEYITSNSSQLKTICEGNTYAKKGLPDLLRSPEKFAAEIYKRRDKGYTQKLFPELLAMLEDCGKASEECNDLVQTIMMRLYCHALQVVSKGVLEFKLRNNLLSYDDMIGNLHRALVEKENPALVAELKHKYKAVFIDEFQDTDRLQFEIFDTAFGKDTMLFYIGDPKQSIYAWRKADIFTYFKARGGVDRLWSMNKNYRSTKQLIQAMNCFFLPAEGFDTFHFGTSADTIKYFPVGSPAANSKGDFYKDGVVEAPISVFRCGSKEELHPAIAAQVAALLKGDVHRIGPEADLHGLRPSDIGILVRTGQQGKEVKAALAELGIPAVTIDEAKVLQSEEATYLLYLLEAMALPDRSSINRALLSPFTGLGTTDLLALDDEAAVSRFTVYKELWQQDGIYTALQKFITDFGVRERLLTAHTESGERLLTNLYQLTEVVHAVDSKKNFSMPELISWLRRAMDGMATEGDEFEQRVESDEESVRIVTIHKSKGLEYKIVFAPFLDFVPRRNEEFFSFRDPGSGDYVGIESNRISDDQKGWYKEQAEQENRRLLYVAITRAVYKCYIYRVESSYYSGSTLAYFLGALNEADPELICNEAELPMDPPRDNLQTVRRPMQPMGSTIRFSLRHENWRRLSYTGLAAKHILNPKARANKEMGEYDNFIFSDLKRGRKTGDLLHHILERISFGDKSRWDDVLAEALGRFIPAKRDIWVPMLRQLLEQVVETNIGNEGSAFRLADVAHNRRIAEFEFDFPVSPFVVDGLQALSDDEGTIRTKYFGQGEGNELEGVMNGKMDLFFEQGGKYYILDWKSNYLGDSTTCYSADALMNAMNEENYHLQYLIYCLAAKKYLESRIEGFDYEKSFGGVFYLFLRGMRIGSKSGIFTCKPSVEKIARLELLLKSDRKGRDSSNEGGRVSVDSPKIIRTVS